MKLSLAIIFAFLFSCRRCSEIYLEHIVYSEQYQTYMLTIGFFIPLNAVKIKVDFSHSQSYLSLKVPVFSKDIDKFLAASGKDSANRVKISVKSGYNQSASEDVPFYFELPTKVFEKVRAGKLKFPGVSPLKLKSNLELLPKDYQLRYEGRIAQFVDYYRKKYVPESMRGFYAKVPGLIFNEFSGKHVECQQRNWGDFGDVFEDLSSMEYEEIPDFLDEQSNLRRGYRFAFEAGGPKSAKTLNLILSCGEARDSKSAFIVQKNKILEQAREDFKARAQSFVWHNNMIGRDDLKEFYDSFCGQKTYSFAVEDFYNSVYALIQLESIFENKH